MTSVHRRLFVMASTNPDEPARTRNTYLGMHFSTARPLEVRLRLPIKDVWPSYSGPGTYAAWSFDRLYLRASAMIVGSKYGIGDVQCGVVPSGSQWLAYLRHGHHRVVCSTSPLAVLAFLADVERVCPDIEPAIDVDPWIDALLGAQS